MTHTYKARQKSSEGLFTFDVFSESRVMYSEIWKDIMRAISLYISTVYEHEKTGTWNNIQKDKSLNMKELLVWKCTLVSILVYCMIKFWDSVINIALNTYVYVDDEWLIGFGDVNCVYANALYLSRMFLL